MSTSLSTFSQYSPRNETKIKAILGELQREQAAGRQLGTADRIAQLTELATYGGLPSMEPFLPLCLALNKRPFDLKDHFLFAPLYNLCMPQRSVDMAGRQLGKTTNAGAQAIMFVVTIPNFKILCMAPRYEQIRRFSTNTIKPFIDESPIRNLWTGTGVNNSVLQKNFKTGGHILFSFALLDVGRVRGVSCDMVFFDEVQDMVADHLEIIEEALSHSPYKIRVYRGTPKTFSHPIHGRWLRSSQAEWFIKCRTGGCNKWNIPSMEWHIEKMLGKVHDFISEQQPGLVCAYCRKPLSPRNGRWVHRYPDRRLSFPGRHIPQVLFPIHYANRAAWGELLAKKEGWGNTSRATFINEVLGEPLDAGQKLITETALREAATLPWKNNPTQPAAAVMGRLNSYKMRVLAADWSGGGEEMKSYTVLALLGLNHNGQIDCLWGKRFLMSQDHLNEAAECKRWFDKFNPHFFAHDYTGAGTLRETFMVQAGLKANLSMPVQYVRTATRSFIKRIEPTPIHERAYYRLDKARSLLYTTAAIKTGLLRFFEYDHDDAQKNPGLLGDFLALTEASNEALAAGELYKVLRNPEYSDDFAQAVNIGCAMIWKFNGLPNFAAQAAKANISKSQLRDLGSEEYGWEQDESMKGYMTE